MAEIRDPVDVHVGNRLREMRTTRSVWLQRLGDEIGVTYQQVQKYETGANRISASMLWRIAEVLEVGVDWFFDGFGEPDDPAPDADAIRTAATLGQLPPAVRREVCALIDAIVEMGHDARPGSFIPRSSP